MEIKKIVITGGPCGGKTSAIKYIREAVSQLGYTVLCVPETATELISGGVAPWTCGTNAEFQLCQMSLQLEKERLFLRAAETMKAEKLLIVCDRGALDNKAYMTDEEFRRVLGELGENEVSLRDGYDAVFHLVTAADGAEEHYTTANNKARTESLDEARVLDRAVISAWVGNPHFRIIDNSTDFDGKIARLLGEITFFLGEPEPLEIERKYLIEYPDLKHLESLPNCQKVGIVQTYMKNSEGENIRLRRRGEGGHYVYFITQKKNITGMKRIEIERRLTEAEYNDLMMHGNDKRQLTKDRYCLMYDGQYFEIDVYPFWDDKAVMELELSREDTDIRFPEEIKIIKEVTGERVYNNSSLAKPVE